MVSGRCTALGGLTVCRETSTPPVFGKENEATMHSGRRLMPDAVRASSIGVAPAFVFPAAELIRRPAVAPRVEPTDWRP